MAAPVKNILLLPSRLFFTHYTTIKRNLTLNVDQMFESKVYKLHLLDNGPATISELTKETGLRLFKEMDEVRRMEQVLATLYLEKQIRGFCHLIVGQEAICVGLNAVMRPQDTVITSYRCHGWPLLRTKSAVGVIAELLGKDVGVARGKGGSMHMYAPQFFGGNGIVGSHVPLGTGVALKHKYMNTGGISFVLYGDGAANQGQVAEAFNICKLKMLPAVFILENNFYGLGTSVERSAANPEFFRAFAYMPGIRCSGMDILSVMESTKFAMKHVLDGKGPILLEMMTYRYFGHSMSDPGTSYRDRDEIKSVREKKDAIRLLKNLLIESKLATAEEVKKVENENKKSVADALKKAQEAKLTPDIELTGDCYKKFDGPMRLPQMLKWTPHKLYGKYEEVKS